MPRLLLLIPTASYRAKAFVDAARALGADLVVASEEPSAVEGLAPERLLTLDLDEPKRAADAAAAFARAHPLSAVIGVDDRSAVAAAAIAERLGLRGHPAHAARAARDKRLMRRLLADAGVPQPRFEVLPAWTDPETRLCRAYPCVVKPAELSASRGVIRADDPEAFAAAFRRVAALLSRPDVAALCEGEPEILVEEYVPGAEFALEGVLERGRLRVLALFDKPDPLEGPYFEETIYVTPSRLPEPRQAELAGCAARACAALSLAEGPVHAELRLSEKDPVVIEVAARSIGGLCSRVLRFGAGLSLEELILRHALGLDLSFFEREKRPAGVMMLPIPRGGVFREARGLEEAKAVPGIEDVVITVHPGRRIEPLPEGGEYLGFMFARGPSPDAVETALRAAHRRLDFAID